MKIQIRNLLIVFAVIGVVLLVLATCAPAAVPSPPALPTAAPLKTPLANFNVVNLRMTKGGNKCDATAVAAFNRGDRIYVNWKEEGLRGGDSLKLKIENTTPPARQTLIIPHEPTLAPTPTVNRCEMILLNLTPAPGVDSYQTSVDIKFNVTPVIWTIR